MWRASVVAICVVAVSACASAWQLEHPFLYGGDIHAMQSAGNVAIAVGPRGAILRSDDAGRTWRTLASGTAANLTSIAHSDGLWVAVGSDGTVLRSRDGLAFERRPAPTSDLVDVAVAGTLVIAAAKNGNLLRSQDGAERFETLPGLRAALTDLSDYTRGDDSATSIAIDTSGVLLGSALGLWRSTDRGARFTQVTDEPIQAIEVASDGTVYALAGEVVYYQPREICNTCFGAGYATVALYRNRDGENWERRAIDDPVYAMSSWGLPKKPKPPASAPSSLWPRYNFAKGFYGPEVRAPLDPRSLMLGPRGALFVGVQAHRYLSTNRGNSFREISERKALLWAGTGTVVDEIALGGRRVPSEQLTAISAGDDDHVYAVGQAGAILTRTPSGWRKLTTPMPTTGLHALSVVTHYGSSEVVAVGDGGMILESRNGETFEQCGSGTTADLTVLLRSYYTYAAGRGTFLRSQYGCTTWEATPTTMGTPTALWSWNSALYLVDGGIHRSTDLGKTWTGVAVPEGTYRAIWGYLGDIFIVGDAGKLARSRDDGKTWSPLASGTAMDLRVIWGDHKDIYIAGGNAAGGCVVMRSRDRGDSWRTEPVQCQQPVIAIHGSAKYVWIVSGDRPSAIWRGKQ